MSYVKSNSKILRVLDRQVSLLSGRCLLVECCRSSRYQSNRTVTSWSCIKFPYSCSWFCWRWWCLKMNQISRTLDNMSEQIWFGWFGIRTWFSVCFWLSRNRPLILRSNASCIFFDCWWVDCILSFKTTGANEWKEIDLLSDNARCID